MGNYTVVSEDTFDELQLDAGVLLVDFNPASPGKPDDEDIIAATTGGISISCVPTYSDFAEDIDNVPNNTMEFKHLDGWDCSVAFSSVKFNSSNIALALGAADVTAKTVSAPETITPRANLDASDFGDLWWVGDKADGGGVAVKIANALSTGGLAIQTSKNGKGTMAMTITGHVSISDIETVPMEFYILES